jgi:hypothetical protein
VIFVCDLFQPFIALLFQLSSLISRNFGSITVQILSFAYAALTVLKSSPKEKKEKRKIN